MAVFVLSVIESRKAIFLSLLDGDCDYTQFNQVKQVPTHCFSGNKMTYIRISWPLAKHAHICLLCPAHPSLKDRSAI